MEDMTKPARLAGHNKDSKPNEMADTPTTVYQPFKAVRMVHMGEDAIDCFEVNGNLCVSTEDGPIMITEKQVKTFFGWT